MSTTIYTDNELQKLFQDLLQEKERVRDLENKLEHLRDEFTNENEALIAQQKKLKALCEEKIAVLKSQECNLADTKKLAETLSLYHESLHLNERLKKQSDKLAYSLDNKDKKIKELEQFEASYKKNIEQKLNLQSLLENERDHNQRLQKENEQFKIDLKNSEAHKEQLERAIQHLRERSEEAQLELNQLRVEYERAQEAIENLTKQNQLIQSKLQESSLQTTSVIQEKQELTEELESLASQFSHLKIKVAESQTSVFKVDEEKKHIQISLDEKINLLKEFEQEITSIKKELADGLSEVKDISLRYVEVMNEKSALSHQLRDLHRQKQEITDEHKLQNAIHLQERAKLEETINQLNRNQEDQDVRLKVAQQHLGKKLKELGALQEHKEQDTLHIQQLEQALSQMKISMEKMQVAYEEELEKEKQEQENLQKQVDETLDKLKQSEDKYASLSEKLQAMENKQQQVQQMFANLGGMFGVEQTHLLTTKPPQQQVPLSLVEKEPISFDRIEIENIQKNPEIKQQSSMDLFSQANIFEEKMQRSPIRQNLFD